MSTKTVRNDEYALLGVYLNDHLAGATAGVELARRMVGSAAVGSATADVLGPLTDEITADRKALIAMMGALGIPIRGYKVFAGWAGEKAGRLKFNRRLVSRSPLSSLEEVEILRLGVEGKAAGWRTLRVLADRDDRLDAGRLDELLERARRQSDELETLRASIARQLIDRGGAGWRDNERQDASA